PLLLSFADLVVLARSLNPFPYRTRPLNPSAPMVLSLKAWKSRSLPGLPRTEFLSLHDDPICGACAPSEATAARRGGRFLLRAPACPYAAMRFTVTLR